MTVATGDVIRIPESCDALQEIDPTGAEIVDALPEQERERIVERYNRVCDKWGDGPAESVDELPDHMLAEWDTWLDPAVEMSRGRIVGRVLEAREDVYIHTRAVDYELVVNLGEPPVDPDRVLV